MRKIGLRPIALLQPCRQVVRLVQRRFIPLVLIVCGSILLLHTFFGRSPSNRTPINGSSTNRTFALDENAIEVNNTEVRHGNNLEQMACKLPKLNPFHESVLPHIKTLGNLDCGKSFSRLENDTLFVEGGDIIDVQYRLIQRPDGDDFSSALSQPAAIPNAKPSNNPVNNPSKVLHIKPDSRGCITHRESSKCLHPYGGSSKPDPGANVVLHADCYRPRITFNMEPSGLIRHMASGLCLHGDPVKGEVTLESSCATKFIVVNGSLQIKGNKMCVHPKHNMKTPADNEQLVLSSNCTAAFGLRQAPAPGFEGNVKVNSDFIRVDICRQGQQDTEVHMNVAPKPEVLNRRVKPAGIPVSIAMIMFDSTSAASFQRKMPKTIEYLKGLPTVYLKGETVVGDGTTAQLAAMLTGIAEEDQPEARRKMPNSKPVDNWRFIFRDFAKRGYATMYSEDSPGLGTFNYRLKGFDNPPTDHYGRYFWFEAEKHGKKNYCVGNEKYHMVTMRYFLSLFRNYRKNPKFAFLLFSDLTHGGINSLEYGDEDLTNLLKTMENEKHLENTIVFIFGDHGFRFGPLRKTLQGKLEERLPHMSVTFPKWFPRKFPELYINFCQNSELLTTPFDIYATLQHVLSYPLPPEGIKTGQSLFVPIDPQKRTCATSGVEDHWCPCLNFQEIPVSEPVVQEITNYTLKHINTLLDFDSEVKRLCHKLTLKEIKVALTDLPNEKLQTFETSFQDHRCDSCGVKAGSKAANTLAKDALYQIQFVTAPNDGFFEASVKLTGGKPVIKGDISRVDKFGHQPDCIKDTYVHLIKYCYCK